MNEIRWFDEVGMGDVPAVGGKNASLGEMRRALTTVGIRTADGFATTADAYRAFLRAADLERVIDDSLRHLDVTEIEPLQAAGARVRSPRRRAITRRSRSSWSPRESTACPSIQTHSSRR